MLQPMSANQAMHSSQENIIKKIEKSLRKISLERRKKGVGKKSLTTA
jgi:hypothetical protein